MLVCSSGVFFVLGLVIGVGLPLALTMASEGRRSDAWAIVAVLAALLAFIGSVVMAGALLLGMPFRTFRPPNSAPTRQPRWFLLTAGFMLFVLAFLTDTMWLPPEVIDKGNGQQTVVYVLAEDERSLVVLNHADRTVERVDARPMPGRRFCAIRSTSMGWFGPVRVVLGDSPEYPKCPSS